MLTLHIVTASVKNTFEISHYFLDRKRGVGDCGNVHPHTKENKMKTRNTLHTARWSRCRQAKRTFAKMIMFVTVALGAMIAYSTIMTALVWGI
jgi:hypothetical protein